MPSDCSGDGDYLFMCVCITLVSVARAVWSLWYFTDIRVLEAGGRCDGGVVTFKYPNYILGLGYGLGLIIGVIFGDYLEFLTIIGGLSTS